MNKKKILKKNIDLIVMDFDGVFTNNKVIVDEDGKESVVCSRSDGLAITHMNKFEKNIKMFVLSTEKNNVVKKRANKLHIKAYTGKSNKLIFLINYLKINNIKSSRCLYLGNDINDYDAMKICRYRACPSDSHPLIKKIATNILKAKGGDGVVRELIERTINCKLVDRP